MKTEAILRRSVLFVDIMTGLSLMATWYASSEQWPLKVAGANGAVIPTNRFFGPRYHRCTLTFRFFSFRFYAYQELLSELLVSCTTGSQCFRSYLRSQISPAYFVSAVSFVLFLNTPFYCTRQFCKLSRSSQSFPTTLLSPTIISLKISDHPVFLLDSRGYLVSLNYRSKGIL